jgi:hypothetical protein
MRALRLSMCSRSSGAGRSAGWIFGEDYVGAGSSDYRICRTVYGARTWEVLIGEDHGEWQFSAAFGLADSKIGLMTFVEDAFVTKPYVRRTRESGSIWGDFLDMPAPAEEPNRFSDDVGAFCGTYRGQLFSLSWAKVVVLCEDPYTGERLAPLLSPTIDVGETWQSTDLPEESVLFISLQVGWALGKTVYQILDGGEAWTERGSVTWTGQFSFVDTSHGWAVGESRNDEGRVFRLYRTEDGGRTWIAISPSVTS